MTPDKAKELTKYWLNRGRSLHNEIKQLTDYREKLLNELGGGVASYTPREIQQDNSKGQAHADDLRLEYSETCDKIEKRVAEFAKINNTTLDYIQELDKADERAVLTGRHVNFKKWSDIYGEMYISRSTAFEYYEKALNNMFRVLYLNNADFRYMVDVENTKAIDIV